MFDEKPACVLQRRIEAYGIEVLTGEKAIEFKGTNRVQGVVTDKREIDCDMVILTLGIRPAVELCRKAGVEKSEASAVLELTNT